MTYSCVIYNDNYTFGGRAGRDGGAVALVGVVAVRARSGREAAARAYVLRVGRERAQLLEEVLHAPRTVVECETDPRAIAKGLARLAGRLGDCYCLDNMVEAWYITVEPTSAVPHLPTPRRLSPPRLRRRRRLLRSLQTPALN